MKMLRDFLPRRLRTRTCLTLTVRYLRTSNGSHIEYGSYESGARSAHLCYWSCIQHFHLRNEPSSLTGMVDDPGGRDMDGTRC